MANAETLWLGVCVTSKEAVVGDEVRKQCRWREAVRCWSILKEEPTRCVDGLDVGHERGREELRMISRSNWSHY